MLPIRFALFEWPCYPLLFGVFIYVLDPFYLSWILKTNILWLCVKPKLLRKFTFFNSPMNCKLNSKERPSNWKKLFNTVTKKIKWLNERSRKINWNVFLNQVEERLCKVIEMARRFAVYALIKMIFLQN